MGESRTLARERGGSEREHGEERVDTTVKEGRFQGGKGFLMKSCIINLGIFDSRTRTPINCTCDLWVARQLLLTFSININTIYCI